jgi:hypothetical protein
VTRDARCSAASSSVWSCAGSGLGGTGYTTCSGRQPTGGGAVGGGGV